MWLQGEGQAPPALLPTPSTALGHWSCSSALSCESIPSQFSGMVEEASPRASVGTDRVCGLSSVHGEPVGERGTITMFLLCSALPGAAPCLPLLCLPSQPFSCSALIMLSVPQTCFCQLSGKYVFLCSLSCRFSWPSSCLGLFAYSRFLLLFSTT